MNTAAGILTVSALAAALLSAPRPVQADDYRSLARNFSGAASQGGVKRVAVLAFTAKGDASQEEADYVAVRITARLCEVKKGEGVERALLEKVLGEHRLMASLLTDTDLSKGLSGLISAEAAVTGEVFAAEGTLKIAARLIDLRTGRVLDAFELNSERQLPPADFRDSPSGGQHETCGARRAELDRLNRGAAAAKAKYWAVKLKEPGFSYSSLRRNLGSELREPGVKAEFYRELLKYSAPGASPELKARDLAVLHALLPREEMFYDDCGL